MKIIVRLTLERNISEAKIVNFCRRELNLKENNGRKIRENLAFVLGTTSTTIRMTAALTEI